MTAPGPLTKSNAEHIPAEPGSYYLHLMLSEADEIQIGCKGFFRFQPGHYYYCGTALGPGGLRSRLRRHLDGIGKRHWHIDWLRQVAVVAGWGYQVGTSGLECEWSQEFSSMPGAVIPVPGFGASDCSSRCRAHLVYFVAGNEPMTENRVKLGNVIYWRTF
jgi:Uri superfamily endonuclease